MARLRIQAPAPAVAVLVLLGLAAAGCGQEGGADGTRSAGDVQRSEIEQRTQGGDARGKDGESVQGEDGARGGDASQSSSTTQSGEGGSGDQSSSIVQRSDSGSVSSSNSSGPGLKTFSGRGETSLSFNVEEPARLAWTNTRGKPFSVRGDGISIDSRSGRGEVSLAPGDYDGVKVKGSSWTIVVRPR